MKNQLPASYNNLVRVRLLRWVMAALTVALMLFIGGCHDVEPEQGYTSSSLYRTDIKTVFVEMFESESFRRGIEFDLTPAIVSRLELHSPYKVVSDRRKADTVLYGSINRVIERRLAQQRELDRPLANEVILVVTANWQDLRSGEFIFQDRRLKVSGTYVPMLGSGRAGAEREAANELAQRIIEQMEQPW
ncbi:MAG: hypothetical protein JXD22_10930 [Sedimentisphaerales bacterium]|nr:hypothetical protein [Sedimentisphaerales bacterium]